MPVGAGSNVMPWVTAKLHCASTSRPNVSYACLTAGSLLASASSDLAVIIDALIYRLGQGLFTKRETDSPDSVAPSDETLRDEDAEPPEFDGHVLAKACRGKVNEARAAGLARLLERIGKSRSEDLIARSGRFVSRLCDALPIAEARHFWRIRDLLRVRTQT
jgi:hypothetical protein